METLPREIIKEIFSFHPSIFHIMASVCKEWRVIIDEIVSRESITPVSAIFNDYLYHFMKSSYELHECPYYLELALIVNSKNCYRYLSFLKKWNYYTIYWNCDSLLLWAVQKGHMKIIELYINHYLNLDVLFQDIIDRAIIGKQPEVIKYFLKREVFGKCHIDNDDTIMNIYPLAIRTLTEKDYFEIAKEIIDSNLAIVLAILSLITYTDNIYTQILMADFDLSRVNIPANLITDAKNYYYTSAIVSAYYSQHWHIVKEILSMNINLDLVRARLPPLEREAFDQKIIELRACD